MAGRQLPHHPRLQRLVMRRAARSRPPARRTRTPRAQRVLAEIASTPMKRGARSAVSHAAARDREARQIPGNLFEKPVTEIMLTNTQNDPYQPREYLQYQRFQPKEKQFVTDRQVVPQNPVRQPRLRNSTT